MFTDVVVVANCHCYAICDVREFLIEFHVDGR